MKISVISINFNNAEGLRKTIESVVNQTFNDFEYIIIDGGSSDESVAVIKNYASRIPHYVWISEPDSGIYNAMNKGIVRATGDYCLFLNSGDCLAAPDVLQQIAGDLDEEIVYGDVYKCWRNRKSVKRHPDVLTFSHLLFNTICHQAVFFRRSLFSDRLYNEHFKVMADWEFLLIAICKNQCSYKHVALVIAVYDMYGVSSESETKALIAKEKAETMAAHFRLFVQDYEELKSLRELQQALKASKGVKYMKKIGLLQRICYE